MLRRCCVVLRRDVWSLVSRMVPQHAQHGSETDGDSDADADAGADAGADACGSSGQHRLRGSDEQDPVIGLLSLAQVRACMPWQARAPSLCARARRHARGLWSVPPSLVDSSLPLLPQMASEAEDPTTTTPRQSARQKRVPTRFLGHADSDTPTSTRRVAAGADAAAEEKRRAVPRSPQARCARSPLRAPSGALASSRADARTRSGAS